MKLGTNDITLKLGSINVDAAYLGTELVYSASSPSHDYSQDYFTIHSLSDNNTITLKNNAGTSIPTTYFSYSTDNGSNWTSFSISRGSTATIATINNGDRLMLKGSNTTLGTNYNYGNFFRATDNFEIEGNIMSLLRNNNTDTEFSGGTYNFAQMFSGCTNLVNAENLILPATTLVPYCYNNMFRGCTSLTKAPELPATTLAVQCYSSMFEGCTSLIKPPSVLQAQAFEYSCYQRMFCMSRNSSVTAAMTYTPKMYGNYNDVAFAQQMFCGNGSLNTVECYITRTSGDFVQENFMQYTNSSGTFKKTSTQTFVTGVNGIPSGWTIENVGETPTPQTLQWVEFSSADTIPQGNVYGIRLFAIPNGGSDVVIGSDSDNCAWFGLGEPTRAPQIDTYFYTIDNGVPTLQYNWQNSYEEFIFSDYGTSYYYEDGTKSPPYTVELYIYA